MIYILFFIILLVLELFYFRIADKYEIIDKPNQRSSHTEITLRGGGIIFYLGMILYVVFYHFSYPFFFIGLSLICLVSFIDDIRSLSSKIRFSTQILAVFLMFYQWELFSYTSWWYILFALFFCIGILNAYNFMDGINGMTGGYSLVTLLTLVYINTQVCSYVDQNFIYVVLLTLVVFVFFNFRKKAKCFAGDIGSVGIAFILLFVLGQLVLFTENFYWIVFLAVYGVDSVLTILHRLILHENIFQPHRKHIYQIMVNKLHIPHIRVSILYMCIQLLVNLGAIYFVDTCKWVYFISVIFVLSICYFLFIKYHFTLPVK